MAFCWELGASTKIVSTDSDFNRYRTITLVHQTLDPDEDSLGNWQLQYQRSPRDIYRMSCSWRSGLEHVWRPVGGGWLSIAVRPSPRGQRTGFTCGADIHTLLASQVNTRLTKIQPIRVGPPPRLTHGTCFHGVRYTEGAREQRRSWKR